MRGANRDAAQPCPHRSVSPVARRAPEGAKEGLLGSVFGFGTVSKDGERDRANPGLGTADEFIEGAEVSLVTEPAKQPALFCILPGSFLPKWINRRILRLLGKETHRTARFVRVVHEWRAV